MILRRSLLGQLSRITRKSRVRSVNKENQNDACTRCLVFYKQKDGKCPFHCILIIFRVAMNKLPQSEKTRTCEQLGRHVLVCVLEPFFAFTGSRNLKQEKRNFAGQKSEGGGG